MTGFCHSIRQSLFALAAVGLSTADGKSALEHRFVQTVENPVAVVVLCPGMNQDGGPLLEEGAWLDFALGNNCGLMATAYASAVEDLYGGSRRGYYWPEQGSGEALLGAIREYYGADLPILLFGFSGGAQFGSRFVDWAEERILGFSVYASQSWDLPELSTAVPGIVACGERDGDRWQATFGYFQEGRRRDQPWIWVDLPETGHHRHAGLEAFTRSFFARLVAPVSKNPEPRVWIDSDTGEPVLNRENEPLRELVSVFLARSLIAEWADLTGTAVPKAFSEHE